MIAMCAVSPVIALSFNVAFQSVGFGARNQRIEKRCVRESWRGKTALAVESGECTTNCEGWR